MNDNAVIRLMFEDEFGNRMIVMTWDHSYWHYVIHNAKLHITQTSPAPESTVGLLRLWIEEVSPSQGSQDVQDSCYPCRKAVWRLDTSTRMDKVMKLIIHSEIVATAQCTFCDPDAEEHLLYTARVVVKGEDGFNVAVLAIGPEKHGEERALTAATELFAKNFRAALKKNL